MQKHRKDDCDRGNDQRTGHNARTQIGDALAAARYARFGPAAAQRSPRCCLPRRRLLSRQPLRVKPQAQENLCTPADHPSHVPDLKTSLPCPSEIPAAAAAARRAVLLSSVTVHVV
jgi:hypothetical protein